MQKYDIDPVVKELDSYLQELPPNERFAALKNIVNDIMETVRQKILIFGENSDEPVEISAQKASHILNVFPSNFPFQSKLIRKPFMKNMDISMSSALKDEYPETEIGHCTAYPTLKNLSGSEIVNFLDRNIIQDVCFTPQQIRALARKQNCKNAPGILSLEKHNYFPVIGREEIIFIHIVWHDLGLPNKKDKWWFYYQREKDIVIEGAKFFVRI